MIAIPRFTDVRTGAQDAANAATVRTINSAWQVYQAEGGSAGSGKTWPGDYIAGATGSETSVTVGGVTATINDDGEWE